MHNNTVFKDGLRWFFHLLIPVSPQTAFPVTPSLATSPSLAFSPYLSQIAPCMGLMPELLPSTPLLVPGSPTGLATISNCSSTQKQARTDKLEVQLVPFLYLCLFKIRIVIQAKNINTDVVDAYGRCVESFSVETAHGERVTVGMLTPWRLAWLTAVRTRLLSVWTTSKDAVVETSANTSTRLLTYRPGSRPHSTKPVKIWLPQLWWVSAGRLQNKFQKLILNTLLKLYPFVQYTFVCLLACLFLYSVLNFSNLLWNLFYIMN